MASTHGKPLRQLAATGGLALAFAAPTLVLAASPAHGAGCGVWAETPVVTANNIGARGGRSGCAGTATVYVRLKWDRPWSPDPTLDSRSGQYVNVSLLVDDDCLVGKHGYYIDTDAGSAHATSDPRRIADCA